MVAKEIRMNQVPQTGNGCEIGSVNGVQDLAKKSELRKYF